MEKSNVEKVKEVLLYAPVGAFSFAKENVPTFFDIFVNRGKRDVTKTTQSAEEKLSSTKEHGQIVAMGTPIAKSKAEKIANEAKNKGEDLAQATIDFALGAVGMVDSALKSITSTLSPSPNAAPSAPHATNLSGAASPVSTSTNEQTAAVISNIQEQPLQSAPPISVDKKGPTFVPSEFVAGEGDFIAEPVDERLPEIIRAEYSRLSAPEIIDRLDGFGNDELATIRDHESSFRNRQTIIHAINFRLQSL